MARRRSQITGLFALCALLLVSSSALAANWDPFPELPGNQHIGIKKRFDGPLYNDLKKCFRTFKSSVGAEYFGAMVDVTSPTRSRKDKNAKPYVDALYNEWKGTGRLDPDDHVLIALGIQNRAVAIHVGRKWEQLGFKGDVIEHTVEASPFPQLARRRNYTDAMCSLATAIDYRLAGLEHEMKVKVEKAGERLPTLEEELTNLEARVDEAFEADHPFGEELLGRLKEASEKLEEAKGKLESRPTVTVRLSDDARQIMDEVRARLEDYERDIKELDAILKDLESLRAAIAARPDESWEHPQEALGMLATCDDRAQRLRLEYEGSPWEVRDCLREAENSLARADVRHYFLAVALPMLVLVVLLVLALGFIVARLRRRRRALRLLRPELKAWHARVKDMSRRLLSLELDHAGYFAPRETHWQGQSAALDQRAGDAVNRAFLLLAEARSLLARARELHRRSRLLDVRKLEKALTLLRETPVIFESGTLESRRRLSLPLTQRFETTANQVPGELDAAYFEAKNCLEHVGEIARRAAEQAERASQAVPAASAAVAARREMGLRVDHLTEPLHAAMAEWELARQLRDQDPGQAAAVFEAAAERIEQIAERAERGNEIIAQIRGPLTELGQQARAHVRRLRAARYLMKEPGFNPNEELDETAQEADRILELVAAGREEDASRAFDALEADLHEIARRLEVIEQARTLVPQVLEELDHARGELANELLAVRMALTKMSKQAPDEFHELSEELEDLRTAIYRLDKGLEQVRKDHAEQRYLSATADLNAAMELLARGTTIAARLGQIEHTNEKAHREAEALDQECERLLVDLRARTQQPGAAHSLRQLFAEQERALQSTRRRMRQRQANWIDIRDCLSAAAAALLVVREEADADLEAFASARALAEELTSEISTFVQMSGHNAGERAAARAMVDHVGRLVADWATQLEESNRGGVALLREGRQVQRAVIRAREVFNGATSLEQAAEARLAHARVRLSEVDGKAYGYGIELDCRHLAGRLEEARATIDAGDHGSALGMVEAALEELEVQDARAESSAHERGRTEEVRRLSQAKRKSVFTISGAPTWNGQAPWPGSSCASWSGSPGSASFASNWANHASHGSSLGGQPSGATAW